MGRMEQVSSRRDALRDAVLAAAEARIAASGLADIGVREIARDAGCSSGMVYKLFPSHDELILAVNARTLAALSDAIADSVRKAGDPADALGAMAGAYLDYASANTPRWDALFAHRMAAGAELPAWYAEQRDALFDRLGAVIDAASSEEAGARFAQTLFSAVHGVVALGLGGKVGAVSLPALRAELGALIRVVTAGMASHGAKRGT